MCVCVCVCLVTRYVLKLCQLNLTANFLILKGYLSCIGRLVMGKMFKYSPFGSRTNSCIGTSMI